MLAKFTGMIEALIFDVDGTLAETEEAHRAAFNQAFADYDLSWHWSIDDYRDLLRITGGKERIAAFMKAEGLDNDLNIPSLHQHKTKLYEAIINRKELNLRPGVQALIEHCHHIGIKLAIATTTSRSNVDVLIRNTLGEHALSWFDAICCGDEVSRKKPDPEVYQLALQQLGVTGETSMAFEDSEAGLQSAINAGIPQVIITPSIYTNHHNFTGATQILENLQGFDYSLS